MPKSIKRSVTSMPTLALAAFAGITLQPAAAVAQDISQTRPADSLVLPNGTAGTTFTAGVSCDHPVSVVADGSIDALVGHCPRTPVPSAYTLQFNYNSPNVDEFYQGVVVWANAGGLYSDGELRGFDITIDYLDLTGAPQSISGTAALGDTANPNDPKVVTPASLGGPALISGVSGFTINALTGVNPAANFREITLLRAVPEISLLKTAVVNDGGDGFADVGDTITYTYVVTNTDTPTVFNVSVTEPGGADFSGTNGAPTPAYLSGGASYDGGAETTDLRDGETVTFEATYVLTAEDVLAAEVSNSATATGTDFHGVSATDTSGTANNNDTATVTPLLVRAPTANDDMVQNGAPGTPTVVDVIGNDTEGGNPFDPATVVLTGVDAPLGSTLSGDGKTLTVPGEGEWTVAANGEITFTPEATFTGDPTDAPYTVSDAAGTASDPATISIDYGEAPVAEDDPIVNPVIEPVTLNPLANDNDPDGTLDPASVVLTGDGAPAGATLSGDGKTLTVPGEGVWTVAANGEITFTPEAGFTGTTTAAPYTVDDNEGFTSNPADVTITFDGAPVATSDSVTQTEPGPVTIDPLTNDNGTEPLDPTSVVLTGSDAPDGSTLSSDGKTLTVPGEGEWTVNPTTGLVTFTPEVGYFGAVTPAAYTVSDQMGRASNEAFLSVSVVEIPEIIATNDGPIALDGSNGDTSTASVFDNDTLGGAAITDPSLITLTPVSLPTPAAGSIALNPDGTVTVAPGTTAGTYTLVYEICDTATPTNCATAEVELVVVDTGTGLINEIEEDLVAILSEDLANILTQQSNQISDYSANALDRLRGRDHDSCLADANARLAVDNILFDTDKAIIKAASDRTLDDIAAILISCPGSAFEIAGHTDSDASDAYNIDLSHRRVVAVRQALAARGVDTSGYVARGYGESEPVASNATAAGKAQNRRVEFRPLNSSDAYQGPCDDGFSLTRSLNLNADENGTTADGQFVRDQHDCITDRREVYEGSLSYLDTDTGQTQSAINLSYRREQYKGGDSVFGYFVGLYGSQSEVTALANGEINGLGLNAGVYGANRLHSEIFVDYYLGAAAGRHSFDLAFARDIGTIDASGDYQYLAGFAGAALSGEVALGETTLTPRLGFDYVYTPGADVDVVAELGGLSQAGDLELDAISGGRIFAEIRTDHLIQNGAANLWINPRVACYQSLGALDGACGVGGSIGIESTNTDSAFIYALELDGEFGEDYTQGSLSLRASRDLDIGTLSGDAGVTRDGNATLSGTYEIKF